MVVQATQSFSEACRWAGIYNESLEGFVADMNANITDLDVAFSLDGRQTNGTVVVVFGITIIMMSGIYIMCAY